MVLFKNRQDAGRQLAKALAAYQEKKECVAIGLPRGGVVVAYEVAKALNLPLDIICARKVGSPWNPELAIGAVTETGDGFYNTDIIEQFAIPQEYIRRESEKQKIEALRRLALYKKNRPAIDISGKIVILVDDGIATGATMKAAIESLKGKQVSKIIVAVPVSAPETLMEIKTQVDETICLESPYLFQAVGQFYEEFDQTTDEEVIELLDFFQNSI
jgi:putative phosphoribosyl transferase